MPALRHSPRPFGALAVAASMALAATCAPRSAAAEGPVSATAKGAVGGALVGGELIAFSLGIAKVNKGWPYYAFVPVGMIGGAVGGYFLETKVTTADPSLYLLAGGVALLIPALVVALNATAFQPPETERTEVAPNEPGKGPAKPPPAPTLGPTTKLHAPKKLTPPTFSMLGLREGRVAFGVPAIELRPLYQTDELQRYGVSQGTEVRIPVLSTSF